ncbi:GNAT family N-acetyltransferase [Poseidonocella sp. HB161398]|uniref:GNAT family N-acetyltransferase n=1 Tax=Poseidonocella sp. HB161398 TaxID=2320855 RepID=UPI001486878C|nr:GNAT family N-acetyltransferase [Poseidonocella sp. HB161398]
MTDYPARFGDAAPSRAVPRREGWPEPALPHDAAALAELVVMAGEGLPLVAWQAMAGPGETAMQVGRRRAARSEGAFSWRNADVLRDDCGVNGALVSYPLAERAGEAEIAEAPALFRPLIALENLATGSWYVNVLAVRPHLRGLGLGTRLLAHGEARARRALMPRASLITGDVNPARRLYERAGFTERARAPVVKDGWDYAGREWLLYVKELD